MLQTKKTAVKREMVMETCLEIASPSDVDIMEAFLNDALSLPLELKLDRTLSTLVEAFFVRVIVPARKLMNTMTDGTNISISNAV